MPSLGLWLMFLLMAVPPLQPSSLPPPDTPEGKAAIANLVLSALERATSFLKKRLPEINLDGVVVFRVLEERMHEWAVPPEPALHESLLRQHVALNRRAEAIGYT
nr:UPF0764 protein C16orf89-like [Manis javanica]